MIVWRQTYWSDLEVKGQVFLDADQCYVIVVRSGCELSVSDDVSHSSRLRQHGHGVPILHASI